MEQSTSVCLPEPSSTSLCLPAPPSYSSKPPEPSFVEEENIQDEEEKYNSQKNELQLAVIDEIAPRIVCVFCQDVMNEKCKLVQCVNTECKGEICGQIFCIECFNYMHKKKHKDHRYDPNDGDILHINDMIHNFRAEVEKGEKIPGLIAEYRDCTIIQYAFATVMSTVTFGSAEGSCLLLSGAEMMAATTGIAGDIVLSGFGYAAFGAGVGALIVCAFELAVLFYRRDELTWRELFKLAGKSIIGNGLACGALSGCVFLGAFVGTPGGPAGIGIGIVGGLIAALVLKIGFNKWWSKYVDEKSVM